MTLPLNTHTNEYKFGQGKVYVDLLDDDGNPTGERFLGNCPAFALSVATSKFEHFSSTTAVKKKDLSVVTQVNFTGKIDIDDVTNPNMALFLGGDVTTVTQTTTPITGEHRTIIKGYEYQLGETAANPAGIRNVSAITVKDTTGVTTYVLDTDYKRDLVSGRVTILAASAIVDGADLQFGYTPVAGTLQRVTTGENASLIAKIRFKADNTFGEDADVIIPSCTLAANGDLPFITDNDVAKFSLDIGVNEKDSNTPQVIVNGQLVT